ncbi:hypothetical protein BHECKSOX_1901 [Bathymodiolus heckerae thiotrophic gill symbiont]|uniref:type II toxin-antitoxin system RelE family toxin n=1 Tax=Bathymodiolus heckerae thiotrophic gill symbiont TaxID=1052212 RepID=UPI0010BABEC3|nr:type II toxin-antitoxin system RelE/ParE family toxin [Bathymodiolus heckerae thiotrophic gill symbiont]SHN92946.1 hypothetical protein BHECKSOX_1901 [Bathymodiolus heckerae thiotrophic gill symbiont]
MSKDNTHKITWTNKAQKDLRKIPINNVKQILIKIDELEHPRNKWSKKIEKLAKHQYDYRMRVGNYRVMFDLNKTAKIVHIEKIGKRDGNTY